MSSTERAEAGTIRIEYQNLLTIQLLYLGILRGFPPHHLMLDFTTERRKKDGAIIQKIKPYGLLPVKQTDLRASNQNVFLLHNPNDELEKVSYLVRTAVRSGADGESTNNIAVNQIPSPHQFNDKKEWVTENVHKSINPYLSQMDFAESENVEFPTILITMYDMSLTVAYKGELDKFMKEVYAFFPDISK